MGSDDTLRLWRFFRFGNDRSVYTPHVRSLENSHEELIMRVIQRGRGGRLIDYIERESDRNSRFYPLAYTLAVCARSTHQDVSRKAYMAIQTVCRTPEQLFMFLMYCQKSLKLISWPRRHRTAIAKWYTANPRYLDDPMLLAKHVTKYRRRHGFSHKGVLKSCHPNTSKCPEEIKFIICYAVKGISKANRLHQGENGRIVSVMDFINDVDTLRKGKMPEDDVVALINKWELTWEQIPTVHLRSARIWEALLRLMPMTALLRNLGKLTMHGLLEPGSQGETETCSKLNNVGLLKDAKLHPIQILSSLNGYRRGQGFRSDRCIWNVNQNIVGSLTQAFMILLTSSSQNPALPRNVLVAINTRLAMENHVVGIPLMNCKQTATALAMTLKQFQQSTHTVTFGSVGIARRLDFQLSVAGILDIESALDSVEQRSDDNPTNFNAPLQYAMQNMNTVNAVIIMTDRLTEQDRNDIQRAYGNFKQNFPDVLFITVCFQNSEETSPVADPRDPNMLDVIGVDAEALDIILSFISGRDQQVRGLLEELAIDERMEEDMEQA